jgi:DNA-binding NarL/FixJ family response regulator
MSADAFAMCLGSDPDMRMLPVEANIREAFAQIQREQPDMVVLEHDAHWPEIWRVASSVRRENPHGKLLVLSSDADDDLLFRVLQCGAAGLVTKDQPISALVESIKRANQGELLHDSARLAELLVRHDRRHPESAVTPWTLAPRELDVLQCVADGMTIHDTANVMGISAHTARTHIKHVLTKLNVHSKTDAVVVGMRFGLIRLSK